jgi:hypothetical protein
MENPTSGRKSFNIPSDMANVALSLCICFLATFGRASFTANRLIDALARTLIFSLENEKLIDANLLFGVAIVAGKR